MRRMLSAVIELLVCLLIPATIYAWQSPAVEPVPAQPAQTQPTAPDQRPDPAQPTPAPLSTQPSNGTPAAPGPNGTYTIRRTSRLVVLDIVARDAKGNVIRDLKREDFHVTELGETQTILNFEQTGAHTLPPGLAIDSTAALDKLAPRGPVNIILLDEFNTRFEDQAFARYSLKKFLDKQPDTLAVPTMLIAVSLEHFVVLKDYTQQKQAVVVALDHHLAAFPWQAQQGGWRAERIATAFSTLMRIAEATVGHQGHKNMIWIGRGFPAINIATQTVDGGALIESAVQTCVNMLRDARVTLYTIDPAGLQVNPGTYGAEAAFDDPFGGNYQFERLALATGGRTLHGRNDVDVQIGDAVTEGTNFYTLTYRPQNDSVNPQKFRKIKVTVDSPGVTLSTRQGYYLQRGPGRVDPEKPSRRLNFDLGAAALGNQTYDGVSMTVTPSRATADAYLIHIDGRSVNWAQAVDAQPRQAEVIVMATTFDKKGKLLKQTATVRKVQALATDPPAGRLERDMNLLLKVDPNPKAVRMRVVVRISSTGRIGTGDIALGAAAPGSAPVPQPTP